MDGRRRERTWQTQLHGLRRRRDLGARPRAQPVLWQRTHRLQRRGPIATAIGRVLGSTPETTIELKLRIRNTAVSELACSLKRHNRVGFNTLPHLSGTEYADWITYA